MCFPVRAARYAAGRVSDPSAPPGSPGSPPRGDDDTGLADTDASSRPGIDPERSPSRRALHERVRAALFEGVTPPPSEYEAGTVLGGRFRVLGLVGRGGMGEVYRARDLVLDEEVAIKFIPHHLSHDAGFMTRFVREVRIARQITHPNVCRVHDIGEVDGRTYLSMEFIDGEDLASLLRRIGRLPLEKATELAQQLCVGLAALHERDVLHRDLKPHNLMVDGRGKLKITDFGLAAEASELAEHELRDGTPAYMAPEQAEGREVTLRSDLYALGLILYEVLTGQRAEPGLGDPRETLPTVASRVSGIPREVDEVIAACLERDPAHRPSSALAVAAALPGADPVATALAAGRTPSIDALLASGERKTLPRTLGAVLIVAIVVALAGLAATFRASTLLGRSDTQSPQVLRHEARRILDEVAFAEGHFFEHAELEYDRPLLRAHYRDIEGRPISLLHFRRQGPPFQPRLAISMEDPPYDEPGAARVTLDGEGRLRALKVVHAPAASTADEAADFTTLLEAAGFDPAQLWPTAPTLIPPGFADHRVAWTGYDEALEVDVRIEASSLGRRVVAFDVIPPWDDRFAHAEAKPGQTGREIEGYVIIPGALLLVLGAAWLARRVVQRGGADVRGAARVATAVAIVGVVSILVNPDLAAGDYHVLARELLFVLGLAMTTYWFYVAVEPFARRYLPGAMTSWVRLVRGHVRDPMVARDVLLGTAMAVAAVTLERVGPAIDGDVAISPATLSSVDSMWAGLGGVIGPMSNAPLLFLVLASLVRLTRRRWAAAAVLVAGAALAFAAARIFIEGGHWAIVASVGAGTLWGLSIAVVGLLGSVSFQLIRNILATTAITLDGTAWYASSGWVALAVVLVFAFYGYRYGVARPPPPTNAASVGSGV